MARKIELRKITMPGANGETEPAVFSYPIMIKELLRYAPPGGLNFDDVVRSVEALKPLEAAIAAAADSVTFTDEQWHTLKRKLDIYQFGVAAEVIVDFGLSIRNAPEIGTVVDEPPRSPSKPKESRDRAEAS
jgi:hypothetical protein